jgi:hypothetical protein
MFDVLHVRFGDDHSLQVQPRGEHMDREDHVDVERG